MQYREFAPAAALAPFVRCFWTMRAARGEMPRQRILPDGSFDIVFHFADAFRQNGEQQPAAMLIGELRRPVVVEPYGAADILGVRFHPGGAAAFLRLPMSELRDQILPLEEAFPALCDPIFAAARTAERIAYLQSILMRRLQPLDRRLEAAIRIISGAAGHIRIADVAAIVGSAERTLERLFDSGVGLAPKAFARVARFQASLRGDHSGYFDEPHRIREFRDLSGLTPTQLQQEQNEMNDHFVGNLQDAQQPAG